MKAMLSLAVMLFAGVASADTSTKLMGTWNVVTQPGDLKTCNTTPENAAYQWIVTVNGTKVSISVLGKTGFPTLVGRLEGDRLVVTGGSSASSVFDMRVSSDGTAMAGTRFYVGTERGRACLIKYTATANKI